MRKRSCVFGSMPRSARYPRAFAPARDCNVFSKNFAASSTMSCSVLRRSSRASASREALGTGTPAIEASRSTASGKDTPSVCITKSKMLPFLPEEKSNQAAFWSFTKNDAVFSLLNGDSPFHSRPAFFKDTRRPTTSETGRRAFKSSRKSDEKRIGNPSLVSRFYSISRHDWGRPQGVVLSRLFTGRKLRRAETRFVRCSVGGKHEFSSVCRGVVVPGVRSRRTRPVRRRLLDPRLQRDRAGRQPCRAVRPSPEGRIDLRCGRALCRDDPAARLAE